MLTGDQDKVRKINKSIVLNTLRLHAPISRARVANLTGLNRSTVSNIVNVLIEEGLVFEDQQESNGIGRPGITLGLRPDGGAVIGVEIGVGFISVLLTNFVAKPLWEIRVQTTSSQSQTEIITLAEKYRPGVCHSQRAWFKTIGGGGGFTRACQYSPGKSYYCSQSSLE
jgi:hypothetical protein